MPIHLGWKDIALRLVLARWRARRSESIAAKKNGRWVAHHDAGGACRGDLDGPGELAAADRRKAGKSFVVMDLMRLPLGILSGMGFIGAGAIVRRGIWFRVSPRRRRCGSRR